MQQLGAFSGTQGHIAEVVPEAPLPPHFMERNNPHKVRRMLSESMKSVLSLAMILSEVSRIARRGLAR